MPRQTKIQHRRGTAAVWTSTNPTLDSGEIGFETDTGKFKIGNGVTAWTSLAYQSNGIIFNNVDGGSAHSLYPLTNIASGGNASSMFGTANALRGGNASNL